MGKKKKKQKKNKKKIEQIKNTKKINKSEEIKKEKKESTALIEVKDAGMLGKRRKDYKVLKRILDIIFKILRFILKITVIVAIYAVVFSTVMYFSNKIMVEKLRESEKNEIQDPVLTIIRENKTENKDKK